MPDDKKGWSRAEIMALIGLILVSCQALLAILTYLNR